MPPRKKAAPAAQKAPVKHFVFNLTLSGVAGITLATFCLFLWMFFLGMWAGRTIISPCPSAPVEEQVRLETTPYHTEEPDTSVTSASSVTSAICVQPRERKRRVSFGEPSLYQGP